VDRDICANSEFAALQDSKVDSSGSQETDAHRLILDINTHLVELHTRRVAELGVAGSGLFDHYATLLANGVLLSDGDRQAFELIQELPRFGEYAVLRAGLGELAFLLAAAGLRVVACEPNGARYEAMLAGLERLFSPATEEHARLRTVNAFLPDRVESRPLVAVATDFVFDRYLENDEALRAGFRKFDALLVNPRLFIYVRETPSEQAAALTFLNSLGFSETVELGGSELVLAVRPGGEPSQAVDKLAGAKSDPPFEIPADYRASVGRMRRAGSKAASTDVIALRRPFVARGGFSWSTGIPDFLCNDSGIKNRVAFRLFEEGEPVTGYSNANHEDIAALGGGRHAFWTDLFCFSTTDNSDPNRNGRKYTLRRISDTTLGLWPLGGCTVYDPCYELEKSGLGFVCARQVGYTASPYTHTVGEHLQLLDYVRNALEIPPELRPFCNVDFMPKAGGFDMALTDLEAVLVEECSDVEVIFRGVVLNRLRLVDEIIMPAKQAALAGGDKHLAAVTHRWYFDGLLKLSPKRGEYAAEILKHMPHRGEADELLRAIIREAAPRRLAIETFVEGIKRIGSLLGKPVGVATHTQYYMPDGRPISWPHTFHGDIMEACRRNAIPFIHPCELVAKYGPQAALQPDMIHWRDDFMPVVGQAIGAFVSRMVGGRP
jgi:hypothetical protein